MKTFVTTAMCLGLLLITNLFETRAADPPAKKEAPKPGRFELKLTLDEKEKSYTHPSKAMSEITRALSKAKRAKEGEEPVFEAVFILNDQKFTFSDPAGALESCKAVTNAMKRLPPLKMGLGDLGLIPGLTAEEKAALNNPAPKKPTAAAVAEVRRRIQMAVQRQIAGSRGRPPSQQAVQQAIQAEIEKARAEGLLPAAPNQPQGNLGVGLAPADPREAKKEEIVQMLAFALGRADSTTDAPAEGAGDEAKTEEEKPAEEAKTE